MICITSPTPTPKIMTRREIFCPVMGVVSVHAWCIMLLGYYSIQFSKNTHTISEIMTRREIQ
jgi:hypothetical protein